MYAVLYQFDVTKGQEEQFETLWQHVTEAFKLHAGGLDSRLHKNEMGSFIAYAQWPDKTTWESARKKLPESALDNLQQMQESCNSITVVFQMTVQNDLLK